jgi:hypothetical protein
MNLTFFSTMTPMLSSHACFTLPTRATKLERSTVQHRAAARRLAQLQVDLRALVLGDCDRLQQLRVVRLECALELRGPHVLVGVVPQLHTLQAEPAVFLSLDAQEAAHRVLL